MAPSPSRCSSRYLPSRMTWGARAAGGAGIGGLCPGEFIGTKERARAEPDTTYEVTPGWKAFHPARKGGGRTGLVLLRHGREGVRTGLVLLRHGREGGRTGSVLLPAEAGER